MKRVVKIEQTCDNCGSIFYRYPSHIAKNIRLNFTHTYCSAKCRQDHHPKRIILTCDCCGVTFYVFPSWCKDNTHHYCSKECQNKHQSELHSSGLTPQEWDKQYRDKNKDKVVQWRLNGEVRKKQSKQEYDKLRLLYNREELLAKDRERYLLVDRWSVAGMLSRAKDRAKKHKVPFSLKKEDIYIPDTCPVLGIPLKYSEGRMGHNSPSLDRIVPERGYVKSNIIVMSNRANVLKYNATFFEIEKLYNWYKQLKEKDFYV